MFRWDLDAGGSTPSGSTGPDDAYSGSQYAYTEASSGADGDFAELYSPMIDISGLTSPSLNFYYHMYGATMGTLHVDVFDGTTWTDDEVIIVGQQQSSGSDPWLLQVVDLSAYSGTIQIRFRGERGSSYTGDMSIDDFSIDEAPTCPPPSGLAASNITATSADLSWNENGSATTWNIEYGFTGFTQGSGTTVTGVTSNPYNLTGLTAATDYDWYVQSDCGGDQSTWVGPNTFSTACATYTPDYLEDFTVFLPDCWDENTGPVTGPTGTPGTSAWIADGFGNNGSTGSARVNLYNTAHQEWLITPNFDLSAGGYELNFDVAVTAFSGTGPSAMGSDDEVQLLVTTDGGNTWSNLMTWNTGNTPSNTGDNITIDISTYTQNPVQFAFWGSDGTVDDTEDYNFYVDNFQVRTQPSCPAPSSLNVTNITATSADLGWTENGSATTWNIEWGPAGFTQGSGTMITGTQNNPHNLAGLTSGTTYDWYVQTDCGGGDQSAWAGPNTFATSITNDDCSGAISLVVGYSCTPITATNSGATDSGETPSCANYQGGDVWFSAVVPPTGYLVVECFNNGGFSDGGMAAWIGSCGSLTEYVCDDDGGTGTMPLIEINDLSLAGQTIYFNVWEYGNDNFGPFDICAYTSPSTAVWTGTTDNDWHTASNWDVNAVPGVITDVTIPAGLTTYPTLTTDGECNSIVIESESVGDGSILGDDNLTVYGTSTVQRYVTAGVWHDFSASMQGQTLNSVYFNHNPDVWLRTYNEGDNGHTYLENLSDPLDPGTGFEIWVDNTVSDVTIEFTGVLQTVDVSPPITNSGSDPQGYNLVGNPFASAIDLDIGTWTLTNVSTSFWVWDGLTYQAYNTSNSSGGLTNGIVPMGQGFFIWTTGSNPVLTIPDDARVHDAQAYYKSSENDNELPLVSLRALMENGYDQVDIVFHPEATELFDAYDTRKLFAGNSAPQIYAEQFDEQLAINGLPPLYNDGYKVVVGYKAGVDGTQWIEGNLENLPETEVLLEDIVTGDMQNLADNPVYKFEANVNDDPLRFIVHFNPVITGIEDKDVAGDIMVYAADGKIVIRSSGIAADEDKEVWVYDLYGRTAINTTVEASTLTSIPANRLKGYVVVRIVSQSGIKTTKVLIK